MNLILKKNISLLLILAIFTPSIMLAIPQKSGAALPVTDVGNFATHKYNAMMTSLSKAYDHMATNKELVLDGIAYAAARILIRQLTQSIVNWINTGFEGSPSFIQNPQAFLAGTVDRTIGDFIFGSDLAFLCSPFERNIKLSLGLQHSSRFRDQINCTLSGALQNIEGAYDRFTGGDFSGGGGWDSWISITSNPQNNQLGALVMAELEMSAKIAERVNISKEELSWGSGILSYKECEEITTNLAGEIVATRKYTGDASTRPTADLDRGREDYSSVGKTFTETNCSTVTPGSLINKQMEAATGSDLTQLQLADEFNEIVGALANYMITSVIKGGLLGASKNQPSNDARWRQDIQTLQADQNSALNTIQQSATAGMSAQDATLFSSSTISTTTPTE